jgi:predicted RNA-binding Zn-ribbon protein involved in translation (DUF1610 family)
MNRMLRKLKNGKSISAVRKRKIFLSSENWTGTNTCPNCKKSMMFARYNKSREIDHTLAECPLCGKLVVYRIVEMEKRKSRLRQHRESSSGKKSAIAYDLEHLKNIGTGSKILFKHYNYGKH